MPLASMHLANAAWPGRADEGNSKISAVSATSPGKLEATPSQ